jgi:hypothetical protein
MKINTAQEYADGICIKQNPKNGLIKEALIEFAKLHVTEALKQASEKARTKGKMGSKIYQIDKTTILNAYDLTNII